MQQAFPSSRPANRTSNPIFREVTVILGDPRLSDNSKREGAFHEEDFATRDSMKSAFASMAEYSFRYLDNHATVLQDLRDARPQFVVNFCDTGFRNESTRELNLPAYLEMLNVPYSGAPPMAMVLAWDKAITRAIAASIGITVPEEVYIGPEDDAARALPDRYPAFVKPACADGSVGITQESIVQDASAALQRVRILREQLPGHAILVQEFLSGTEYGVGIIGNPGQDLTVLPAIEVNYDDLDPALPRLLGFESKAIPDSAYWTDVHFREARLDKDAMRRMVGAAIAMFRRLGLRDYGRFDFRADADGRIKFLECNPNPAWSNDGKLAYMAGFSGISYAGMLRLILEVAQVRAAAERHA